eukprot:6214275-Pleurochrysis_carterae.AAC.2
MAHTHVMRKEEAERTTALLIVRIILAARWVHVLMRNANRNLYFKNVVLEANYYHLDRRIIDSTMIYACG